MAPHAEINSIPTEHSTYSKPGINGDHNTSSSGLGRKPLIPSGALDSFKSFDVTPVIGREFQDVSLTDWLRAPNSDELIRDLAITVSQRGVVFFRAQDSVDDNLQKELAQRLGQLSGKPSSSGLHIHPVANSGREDNGFDDEVSVISSKMAKKIYKHGILDPTQKLQSGKGRWHSDITFEPVPSDYSILRLVELPGTGGDTLWASGYEVYDRISPAYQKFLETLTATCAQPNFNAAASKNNFKMYEEPRGSPENVGNLLEAVHPVIRTNPVTGWKSLFAVGEHVQKINELTPLESKTLLKWFVKLVVENPDLQVRHRWQNPNDLAIWDNRSVYHSAIPDYDGLGERVGHRTVSIGEKPYFDPSGKSREQALREATYVVDEPTKEKSATSS